ncbi:MAG TPA: hypothetical protein VFX59_24825 [Polyangiales bacterium]|nr:hypothetical protein [Polyangiales bacterium]
MRRVSARERAFLRSFFADSLDVDRIWIGSSLGQRSWSPFGARISLTRDLFAGAEVALDDARAASIFAHEALHVWQRQHGRAVTREGAWLQAGYALGRDPYAYDRAVHDAGDLLAMFVLGNIERQGRMMQDYVYAACSGGDTARFRKIATWVQGR